MTEEERVRRQGEEYKADQKRKNETAITDYIAQKNFDEFFSKDPFPGIQPALLNSADIYNYVAATGMICPFYPEKLSGASYEVAVGEKVIWWDEEKQEKHEEDLSESGQYFELKPNSIAFVMLEPMFRIPDYMALRFNLKIMHVYKGLLLGTGPLVDPGFVGKLSIPLHNLTANTYIFRHGDGLIEMEFTKLSPNKAWRNRNRNRPQITDDLYKRKWIKGGRTIYDYISKAMGGNGNVMVRSSIPENVRKAQDMAEETQKDFVETKKDLLKTKKDVEKKVQNIQLITILSLIPVLAFACTAIYQVGSMNAIKKTEIDGLKLEYQKQISDLELEYQKQLDAHELKYQQQIYELEAEYQQQINELELNYQGQIEDFLKNYQE